ncbi:hypothetical protein ASD53_06025 [Lysobacter sp. Root559]|uniref:hypothetical protein n=1 Tax=Lysobacter sp. Root559 TaxID=1736559 RepID=UPI0007018DAC|nr:hypothetical protein [Lysobacter sp. Root559]KQZ59134.1 hypothetical protein ASD53_06025 [Lysobacter sp. Root559]
MPLLLIDADLDLLVEVPMTTDVQDVLALQWRRLADIRSPKSYELRLGDQLAPALAECLDWDLKPPGAAQVTFASSVTRQLGVDLPADVLRLCGAMNAYLHTHGEAFKQQQRARRAKA